MANRPPIEKYELLAQKVMEEFGDGINQPSRKHLEAELSKIVNNHIDAYLRDRGWDEGQKKQYEIKHKDPYFILKPYEKANGTWQAISNRKFEFFWSYFDMDSYAGKALSGQSKNYFYDAIKQFVYGGKEANGSLVAGHYVLKRMSLNSDFKGDISVIRIWVYEETNQVGEKVLRYKSLNSYEQDSSEQNSPYKRIRTSEGYVLKNQYNTLLMGSVHYTHLEKVEGEKTPNDYPEIISLHTASEYTRISLGFSVANYPSFRTPCITQCYIERIDDFKYDFDDYFNNKRWLEDDPTVFIGVRKPTELELSYLRFTLNDQGHKNILIPMNTEV